MKGRQPKGPGCYHWLLLARYEGEPRAHNLRQLVRGHLRGRARVHLAGDLHFYMRYSIARPLIMSAAL